MKIRKSLVLTQSQWQVLDQLATETESRDTYHKSGKVSWRKLIKRITNGELAIVNKQLEVSNLLAIIKTLED